jgi:hypothetical protein
VLAGDDVAAAAVGELLDDAAVAQEMMNTVAAIATARNTAR